MKGKLVTLKCNENNLSIYNIEAVKSNILYRNPNLHNLPNGYTEVEYIQSTGTQYIDTGVAGTTAYGLYFEFMPTSLSGNFQNYLTGYTDDITIGEHSSLDRCFVRFRGQEISHNLPTSLTQFNRVEMLNGVLTWNNLTFNITAGASLGRHNDTIYLCMNKYYPNIIAACKIKLLRLYDNTNSLLRNLIPCYRNSDNKPGMYDLVTDNFYVNQGTGEFLVGPGVSTISKKLDVNVDLQAIYGVAWVNDETTTMIRTDDAVGMTYSINSSTGEVTSDFNNVFPFNQIQIVYDDNGNKFARFPDMWFRIGADANGDINSVAVSDKRGSGNNWYLSKTFDYGCYLASIDENNKLCSKTNSTIATSHSRAEWRTYASNNTENGYIYHQTDLRCYNVLTMLWWIEFATKNSMSVGASRENLTTGASDNITTQSGIKWNTIGTRFHYIEDFIGNRMVWVDGIYGGNNSNLQIPDYVTDNPNYYTDTQANMSPVSWVTPNGRVIAFGFNSNNPLLFTCSKVASSVQGFSDDTARPDVYYVLRGDIIAGRINPYNWTGLCSTNNKSYPNGQYASARLLRQPTSNFN